MLLPNYYDIAYILSIPACRQVFFCNHAKYTSSFTVSIKCNSTFNVLSDNFRYQRKNARRNESLQSITTLLSNA